ncbi:TIGR03086 family metal-binding protein [Streptomyces sp. NPDC054838]
MPETLLRQHAQALRLFGARVRAITAEQWGAPTPCAEWTVRDLVNHVTGEQLWVPPLLTEGRTVGEVGDELSGDLLGEHPVVAWERAAVAAHSAFAAPGALGRTVKLSYGAVLGSAYCSEVTADCVVHAWDLSRAIGADERMPEGLVEFSLKEVLPYADALAPSGMYAEPLEVPPGADAQTRLLGLLGRRA